VECIEIVAFFVKEIGNDNDLSDLLQEKFEAHRKLVCYEQQKFSQLQKINKIKK